MSKLKKKEIPTMTSRDFCYWLQGVFEIGKLTELDEEQVQIVRNHLNMVFIHEIDPSMGNKQHQDELTEAHEGNIKPKRFKRNKHGEILKC